MMVPSDFTSPHYRNALTLITGRALGGLVILEGRNSKRMMKLRLAFCLAVSMLSACSDVGGGGASDTNGALKSTPQKYGYLLDDVPQAGVKLWARELSACPTRESPLRINSRTAEPFSTEQRKWLQNYILENYKRVYVGIEDWKNICPDGRGVIVYFEGFVKEEKMIVGSLDLSYGYGDARMLSVEGEGGKKFVYEPGSIEEYVSFFFLNRDQSWIIFNQNSKDPSRSELIEGRLRALKNVIDKGLASDEDFSLAYNNLAILYGYVNRPYRHTCCEYIAAPDRAPALSALNESASRDDPFASYALAMTGGLGNLLRDARDQLIENEPTVDLSAASASYVEYGKHLVRSYLLGYNDAIELVRLLEDEGIVLNANGIYPGETPTARQIENALHNIVAARGNFTDVMYQIIIGLPPNIAMNCDRKWCHVMGGIKMRMKVVDGSAQCERETSSSANCSVLAKLDVKLNPGSYPGGAHQALMNVAFAAPVRMHMELERNGIVWSIVGDVSEDG